LFEINGGARPEGYSDRMATFIFRCPCTGWNVQSHTEDNGKNGNTFQAIACIACQQLHLVNPETGKVAGEDND
jgi:hypothetical protein